MQFLAVVLHIFCVFMCNMCYTYNTINIIYVAVLVYYSYQHSLARAPIIYDYLLEKILVEDQNSSITFLNHVHLYLLPGILLSLILTYKL